MAALYGSAAKVLEKVLHKKGTVKSLVIESEFANKKKLYALVCETLKYRQVIEDIFEQTKFLKCEKQLKHSFALVLVYELLFGHGLKCGGKFKQSIARNKSSLQSALAKVKIKAKVSRNKDLLPKSVQTAGTIPRYARINTLLTTADKVIKHFQEESYHLVPSTDKRLYVEGSKIFAQDPHIPEVLVFPPSTDLHDHTLYINGHILLQDKASCLPAHVISLPPGAHVIDACAAPGNKSSHLAAKLNNNGRVFSFDISASRLAVMQKQMKKAGATCVVTEHKSFLDVDPRSSQYRNVEYIVVDPSCSGSGIISRLDGLVSDEQEDDLQQRLESLADFQLSVLTHAFSFPAVKKVAYSTCSIHSQENEDVVHKALKVSQGQFELAHALESWPSRGLPVFQGAEKCLRASPESDHTNGFFVALFQRTECKGGSTSTKTKGGTKTTDKAKQNGKHKQRKKKKKCRSVVL
ncbi:predicted protein [Nematostella vectensis]|uniref:SAM-dependent MTase RsmB/NOP-type domain-containing protein n=1 Tax=Nematostella vectensis TaxID=45351 RepID=A7RT21_NEMVE|nr:predicted protein [Nematostella vectensis]|eukprot:XP_001637443.1 predicted protein [Nematostella vectensis]